MTKHYRISNDQSPDFGQVAEAIDREYAYNHALGCETYHLTLRFSDGLTARYTIEDLEPA